MAGFQQVRRELGKKPPRVVVFPPAIFKDDWKGKPTSDVAIGLRVPGDLDISLARANAAALALELHPTEAELDLRWACMLDAFFREGCALGMCSANNVYEPYFPTPEDDVRTKLTPEGAKRVFDEIERLQLETSPVHREATDDEVGALADTLMVLDVIDALPEPKAKRARRLIAFLLDELSAKET